MPLSRLENFIKNVEGNILYVNPSDLDATDSIENQGNSLTRPFKTIQRALIEAARFSYQIGPDNDKFDKTTILIYPGIHKIDNRPGYSIHKNGNAAQYKNRNGTVISFGELTGSSNFDIEDPENVLHIFNGVNGGVIIPRGTSLVGMDLRKTKMFPMFVPDPENSEIDSTGLFKITGGCYFWQFSIFDGDPNGQVYKNYTSSKFTPNFSHHKLTVFEYADGRNPIELTAPTGGSDVTSNLTDLDTYYFKIANAFGNSSGRPIINWPVNSDIEPKLAENQIVGAVQADPIGITSIYSTNNATTLDPTGATGKYIVITTSVEHNLAVGTPIILSGITTSATAISDDPIFNAEGGTLVSDVINEKKFAFVASGKAPIVYPHLSGDESIQVEPDTVTGASPYIFNCSLRSVYGLNGLHADGSKATGFKSMVLAQYTGIGLQKDDNAFLFYDTSTGSYKTNNNVDDTEKPLHINSKCIYKPEYESTHVKVSNSAILQCVSIFAIGFANHFVAESGGDQSITNSNSNFGAKALIARGFRDLSFNRDDSGYITHVIPPKESSSIEENAFWVPLNVGLSTSTLVGYGYSDRLYAFGYTDIDSPPTHIIDSYRIGARENDLIKLELFGETKTAKVLMNNSLTATTEKVSKVTMTGAGNSITSASGTIGLDGNHEFEDGETIRIFSDNGIYPDGLEGEQVYFVIKTGLNANQIKVAKTFNQSIAGTPLTGINNKGGKLTIVSRVSDKLPGDAGHPIQYDATHNNWYIRVEGGSSNEIYPELFNLEKNVTSKTFISRKPDGRNLDDRVYKLRYVIPKEFSDAKPPSAGYVIQESKSTIVANSAEYGGAIQDLTDFRNVRIIHDAIYDGAVGIATITSEKPHGLLESSSVKLNNIRSTSNATGVGNSGFNGIFEVESVVDSKRFTINLPTTRAPGTYIPIRPAVESDRDDNQPNFSINKFKNTFYIYRINTIKEYVSGKQDGIYHLVCLNGSITPTAGQFADRKFSQNVVNLYPQLDRDNYNSDPNSAISVAQNAIISKVTTDDLKHSITKEFVDSFLLDNRLGFEITNAQYNSNTGIATLTSKIQHGLDSVRSVSIASSGAGYGFASLVGVAGTTIYNATLVGGSGEGMTITFTVNNDSNFGVISPTIIDGGSGYKIGDSLTLSAVGIPTFTDTLNGITYGQASFTVNSIHKAVNNPLQVSNIVDFGTNTDDFNGVKRITGVPSSKKVEILLGRNITSIGTFKDYDNGLFNLTGKSSQISTIQYTDVKTGIVTVTCATPHGLNLGNKFVIDYKSTANSDDSNYSGTYTVLERIGINTFTFNIGENVSLISNPTNTGYVLPAGYSSQESDSDESQENVERRMVPFRVGISTTLNGSLNKSSSSISLLNARGFEKGDYIEIGSEIIRITTDFTSNTASIIRGLFGTKRSIIENGSLVKKIKPIPCEGRRYSILRASGHTFEYVGFGPGNYSNALPQRQDRNLSKEEQLFTQSEKSEGGVVVYTGMNDSGDFYVGNRRLSSATGQEETIGIPVPTYVGDDTAGTRLSVVFDDVTVKENIKVEGGASNIIQSEFNGPVLFTNKIINNSDKGADFKFITLKGTTTGDPSTTQRKITVGIATPSAEADNSIGDVVLKNNPEPGGYLGWVFAGEEGTEDTAWRKFGLIATENAEQEELLGTDSNTNSPLGNFTILPSKIGINTNIPQSVFEIVDGTARLDQLSVAGLATFYAPVTLASLEVADALITNKLESRGLVSFGADRGFNVDGNTVITGLTTFTGNSDLNGNLEISGTTSIGGATNITNTLTVSGHADLNRNLNVAGNISVNGTLVTKGAASFASTLDVKGNTSLGGILTLSGHADLNRNLDVSGNTCLGGTLTTKGAASFNSTLTVSGNTDLNRRLDVSGSASIGGTLSVKGAASFASTLNIKNNTSVGGTLTVSGHTDLNRNLNVSGNTSLHGTLVTKGAASFASTLNVKNNTSVGGTLNVSGNTTLNRNLTVSGATNITSTLSVSGHTDLNSDLNVSGNTSLNGTLVTKGATSLASTLNVKSNTSVGGTLNVSGHTTLNRNLSVSGNTSLNGTLVIKGATSLASTLNIKNNTSVGGTLTVSGHTDLNRNLDVSGNTCLGGTLTTKGNASFASRLDVKGNTCLGGTLTVKGLASFDQDITVCGNTLYTGSLNVSGNACVGGTLDVGGNTSVGGTLHVKGHASFDDDITICGNTLYTGSLSVSGNASVGGNLHAKGNTCLGKNLLVSGNATICGSICVGKKTVLKDDVTICGDGNLRIIGRSGMIELIDTEFNQPRLEFKNVCSGQTRYRGYIEPSSNVPGNTSGRGLSIYTGGENTEAFTISGNHTIKVRDPFYANYPNSVFKVDGTTGNTEVDGTLDVGGDVSIGGNATITGNVSAVNATFTGSVCIATSLHTAGTASIGGKLTAKSSVSIGSNLTVSGSTHVHGNISMAGTLITDVAAGSNENVILGTMGGNDGFRLRMGGATDSGYIAFDLKDNGTDPGVGEQILFRKYTGNYQTLCTTLTLLDRSGNTKIPGNLQVGGTLSAIGNAVVSGSLGVSGKITGKNGLDIRGNTSLNGNVYVSGTVCVTQNIHATGTISASELRSTLVIASGQTICADVDIIAEKDVIAKDGDLKTGRNLYVSGFSQLTGEVKAGGNVSAVGSLNVRSSAKINTGLTISAGKIDLTNTSDAIRFKRSGQYPTSIIRNDGTDFYILYSNAGNNLSDWNNYRPLRIRFSDGKLFSSNGQEFSGGQAFAGGTTIGDGLTVCASATICGNLTVCGNATFAKKVNVSGLFSSKEICTDAGFHALSISIGQGADINGNLDIGGNTCLGGTLLVKGSTTLSGATTINNTLHTNNISSSGTLKVDGNTSLHKNLTVSGNTKIKSNLNVAGKTSTGSLRSSGTACMDSELHVRGGIHLHDGSISMGVGVNGNRDLLYGQIATNDFYRIRAGGGSNSGYLAFDVADDGNNSSIGERILFRKYGNANGSAFGSLATTLTLLDRSGNTQIPGNLRVGGTLSVDKKANTSGLFSSKDICSDGTIHGLNVSVGNNITVSTLNVRTNAQVSGSAGITGSLTVSGGFSVKGNSSFGGNLSICSGADAIRFKLNSSNSPTIILHNNGSDFYLLYSNSCTNFRGYNNKRPLRINYSTGKLYSNNGQAFAGGTTIGNGLTVCASATICGSLSVCSTATISGNLTTKGGITVNDNTISFNNIAKNTTRNLIYGVMADNDFYRIQAGGGSNTGFLAFDVADDGNNSSLGEEIIFRKYSNVFTTLAKRVILLDRAGDTQIQGNTSVGGTLLVGKKITTSGLFSSKDISCDTTIHGLNVSVGNNVTVGNKITTDKLTVTGKTNAAGIYATGNICTDSTLHADAISCANKIKTSGKVEAGGKVTASLLISTAATFRSQHADGLLIKNGSAKNRAAWFRNDGANFYFLISKKTNGIAAAYDNSWDSFRPLRIEMDTGNLYLNGSYHSNGSPMGQVHIGSSAVATPRGIQPSFLVRAFGRVNGSGQKLDGEGYTVTRQGEGDYKIEFTHHLPTTAVVTATPEASFLARMAIVHYPSGLASNKGFVCRIISGRGTGELKLKDNGFSFIVMSA